MRTFTLLSATIIAALLCFTSCQHRQPHASEGDRLYALADSAFEAGDADAACQLLRSALASYRHEGEEVGMATAWLALAQVLTEEMQLDTAANYVQQALRLQVGDSLHAALLAELGAICSYKGDHRQSVAYARRAIEEGGTAYDGEDKALTCGNAAIAYRRLGMADSARFFLEEGIKTAEKLGCDGELAFLYNNLATAFSQSGRHDEAIRACRKAHEAALRAGDEVEAMNARANEGVILMHQGEVDKAVAMLEETLAQTEKSDNILLQMKTLTYLLQASLRQGDEAKMRHCLQQGERLAASLPVTNIQASGLLGAMVDIKLKEGDCRGALDLLAKADSTALQSGTFPRDAYLRQKALCMAGLGDYRQAYHLDREAMALADTLRGEAVQRQLSELSEQLKAREREAEIARLNRVAARRQLLIVLTVAALAILSLLGFLYVYWQRRRKERELAQKYLEGLERERARFARELHDGACNELLGIGMAINTHMAPPEEVARRIGHLRETLRNLSHELMPPQFDVATLDKILAHYLGHVTTPAFDVAFTATGDFSALPKHVAYELYRITQEAVGNIIAHASATKAQVRLSLDGHAVSLTVADNGQWDTTGTAATDEGKPTPTSGMGMRLLDERAKSIGGTLTTKHDAGGTTVSISTPIG